MHRIKTNRAMEKTLFFINAFEKRNNLSIAVTIYGDGSFSVEEFWDKEKLKEGKSITELHTFLFATKYKLDEKGRSFSPVIEI